MKNYFLKLFSVLVILTLMIQSNTSNATTASTPSTINTQEQLTNLIDAHIQEKYNFYGLARYFNQLHYFLYSNNQISQINLTDLTMELNQDTWLLVVGRYNVLILQAEQDSVAIKQGVIEFNSGSDNNLQSRLAVKSTIGQINPSLEQLRYHQLISPLAKLSVALEWLLKKIGVFLNLQWGIAIIVFALLIRVLLLPITILTMRSQSRVSQVQAKLAPELAEIKMKYDGEQAHEKIMAAHKNHGVTPFYSLKPLMSTLLQIPVLIALFNVLGEMPELKGAGFLWIKDLAYPDALAHLSTGIILFGDKISLLPILMTMVALLSSYSYRDINLPPKALKSQRNKLLLMSLVFFVLFYPFPAAMVLYWMFSNLFQLIQQKFLKV